MIQKRREKSIANGASFIQNFGSTLNLHPHFHLVVADGVFSGDGEQLQFHEAILTPDD
ncbi:MAG: transposase, partial [Parachlamydiaceae bacterium]|nr:transposase [Parachlamydiaceae bacterium]